MKSFDADKRSGFGGDQNCCNMCCSFVEMKEEEGMEEVGAGDYSLSSKV